MAVQVSAPSACNHKFRETPLKLNGSSQPSQTSEKFPPGATTFLRALIACDANCDMHRIIGNVKRDDKVGGASLSHKSLLRRYAQSFSVAPY